MVREFVRTLPGSIISAVTTDAREPGKSETLLTLEQFEGRLFRCIFDEYAFK